MTGEQQMKITMLGVLAAILLTGMPAYATKEFDCPPAQEVQSQRNEAAMSEDLLEKRGYPGGWASP